MGMKYLYVLAAGWALAMIVTAGSGHRVEDIAITGLVFMSVVSAIAIFLERKKPGEMSSHTMSTLDNRLNHIQEQLDAVAIEVERIGEGQRFLTKLAAERDRVAVLPPGAGETNSKAQ
jgi:hypothetical protein